MAKLYGEIAAKALLTLDKSFARANGQPLDASEVYYSLQAAKDYAATAQAYIGQKIVVVEDGVVTHYSVEDTAGNLKELGSKPVGDEKSITVAENGTVSLKGVGTLVFERDILDENEEPTGEKEEVQYQPLMTKAGLVWIEPSKTTVEGLATLIDALTGRVGALEGKVGAAAAGETAATGIYALIDAETARAEAAEKALDDAIKAIDFVDTDELADAVKDFTTKTYVDEEVGKKVDSTTYATDKKALQDEDAAIREIAENAQTLINDFLTGTDTDEVVNKLQEIQAELDKLGDVVDLEAALALKADLEYVNQELAKKQDTIPAETYDAYGAAAAAQEAAAADATAKADAAKDAAIADAAGKYATTGALEGVSGRVATLEGIDHTAYATKTELKATDDIAKDAQSRVGIVEGKIDEITSVGGEPNVVEKIKVNGVTLEVEKDAEGKSTKSVNIPVPTKTSDLEDDTFGTLIEAAQGKANKAESDAAAAQSTADAAAAKANANEGLITALDSRVGTAETKINENAEAIANHATEFATLKGRVDGHDTALEGKADKTVVEGLGTTVGEHTGKLNTLETSTIPALQAAVEAKAAATALTAETERATAKENELAGLIATISGDYLKASDKTALEQAIAAKADTTALEAEVTRATEKEAELAGLISGNTTAIATLNGEAGVAGSVATIADARIAAALAGADADFDTLKEMSDWLSEHKGSAAEMNSAITENANAIKAINETTIPAAITEAKGYTDAQITALDLANTYEAKGAAAELLKAYAVKSVVSGHEAIEITNTDGVVTIGFASEIVLNGGAAN